MNELICIYILRNTRVKILSEVIISKTKLLCSQRTHRYFSWYRDHQFSKFRTRLLCISRNNFSESRNAITLENTVPMCYEALEGTVVHCWIRVIYTWELAGWTTFNHEKHEALIFWFQDLTKQAHIQTASAPPTICTKSYEKACWRSYACGCVTSSAGKGLQNAEWLTSAS